jgi:hypothetical protein
MRAVKNGISSISFNSAGYPTDWDEITLSKSTQEFTEATRVALNDCDTDFESLQLKDNNVALLKSLFDGEPVNPNAIELS